LREEIERFPIDKKPFCVALNGRRFEKKRKALKSYNFQGQKNQILVEKFF